MEEPWRARPTAPLLRLLIPRLAMPADVSAQTKSRFPSVLPQHDADSIANAAKAFRAPLLGQITGEAGRAGKHPHRPPPSAAVATGSLITKDSRHIGRCAKGQIPGTASPADRLIIEWTAQL
jgi:hypothetical protein